MKSSKRILAKLLDAALTFAIAYFILVILCGLYGACVWLLKNAVTAVGIPYGVAKATVVGVAAVLTGFGFFRERKSQ